MHRLTRRTSALRAAVMACFVASAAVPAARSLADIPGFTQAGPGPTDYTLNSNGTTAGVPSISGGVLTLTTAVNNQTSSEFYNTTQNLSNWTASFTYTPSGGSNPPADGFAFVLQNQGLNALGGGGGAVGYAGITNSAALVYDVIGGNGTNPGRTALGFGGNIIGRQDTGNAGGGVNLRNPFNVNLAFDNGYLTQTITQGGNTVTRNTGINLAARLGGTTGTVGFTGATGGLNVKQDISAFVFTNGNAPAAAPLATLIPNVPQGGAGFFGIREVINNGNVGNLTEAETSITNGTGTVTNYTAPVLNIADNDTPGRIGGDSAYRSPANVSRADQGSPAIGRAPNVGDPEDVDNIAVVATGRIRVPAAGTYTFAVASDDGFRLTIAGQRFEGAYGETGTNVTSGGALQFPNGRGAGNTSFGSIYLPAGDHDLQLLNWEGGGGASVELASAAGLQDGFNNSFNLVGAPAISARRFSGQVSNVNIARFNNPVGGDGAARLNNIFARFQQYRASGTGADAVGTLTAVNTGDPEDTGGGAGGPRSGGDIPAIQRAPGDNPAGGDDNYGLGVNGTLTLAAGDTGRYTFIVRADDDSAFRILGPGGTPVPLVGTNRTPFDSDGTAGNDTFVFNGCCDDAVGRFDLSAPGAYTFETVQQEGGGGSYLQVYGAIGDYASYDPSIFQILGQNLDATGQVRPAGLELVAVPEPGTIGVLAMASLALLGRRRRA